MSKLEFYEHALRYIEGFRGIVGDRPMYASEQIMWAREFAHEALAGIDPATGRPADLIDKAETKA